MNRTARTENPPPNWTPESDSDPRWQRLTALLRESTDPQFPGESRWEEMRSTVWREAGIGETAEVVPMAAASRARSSTLSRVIQIAAVGVTAFALGWVLSPPGVAERDSPQIASAATEEESPAAGTIARPEGAVVDLAGVPHRITPSLPSDGMTVPVSADSAPSNVNGPRHVVIRDSGSLPHAAPDAQSTDLLPDFVRTLRNQAGDAITADAVLASADTMLREASTPEVEASLHYLKAEIYLLEKADRDAAATEYNAVLRLTNNEGALAENARSRLASMR